MSVELGERNSRGVSHERNVMFVRNLSQRREVSHLKLRIGDYFEEDAAGVGINGAAHLVEIRQSAPDMAAMPDDIAVTRSAPVSAFILSSR